MNDPGLEDTIQDTATHITHSLRDRVGSSKSQTGESHPKSAGDAFRKELQVDEDEEEIGYFAPQRWWFTSTAFPLIAGTFGPLANLFSVCALVQTWRVKISDGESETQGQRISDPHWLVGLNAASLLQALAANLLLLFNFAHRIRYIIAQPLTISLWYSASILLIVPLALTPSISPPSDVSQHALSQSYYYALLSAILYVILATLLLLHLVFSLPPFSAYPASFATLTIPQRTLMLQTISFTLYLALGAGIFSALEGWEYCDGVYWADYTLLTIGLGSDFPLQTSAGRGVLIPYAGGGILLIGIVIGSVRGLVLERGGVKMMHRQLAKERDRGMEEVKERIGKDAHGQSDEALKAEFEAMRQVSRRAEISRKYKSLMVSFLVFLIVWFLGAMVFFFSEADSQNWAYGTSLYFTYTTLLTIGYGDLYPESNSGKPFFVLWTLIAIPSVTILISNMGDTVVAWVQKGTMWLGQRTILPERSLKNDKGTTNNNADDSNAPTNRVGCLRQKGSWPLKSPESVEKAVHSEEAREVEVGAVPDPSRTKPHDGDGGGDEEIRGDFEKFGGAVETIEKEHGQEGGIAAKLAREIRLVSKDLGMQPPIEYEWEDWKRWMRLLSDSSSDAGDDSYHRQRRGGCNQNETGLDGLKSLRSPTRKNMGTTTRSASRSDPSTPNDDDVAAGGRSNTEGWIWLGDEGPLFSNESEAKWVLGKLCDRLERVLMKEVQDARTN
ncbi:tandem pore domain K+ channel [Lentinula aciculospora]|uniref:Tandem pore domain K+ channel n=1 Tax=Lentinula aciculospora TaxID=153920 RepID=A0A9W9DT75_9AGAR|nr:tandem pore domain K+ channel [Lentinula aciculospora]